MPIYPYACKSCQHIHEVLQGIHDPNPSVCPNCGGEDLVRQFGLPSVRCRGSARTMGSLAEDNTYELIKNQGRERAERILHENVYGKGERVSTHLPNGMKIIPRPDEIRTPWWRTGEVPGVPALEKPLDVRMVKDQQKYVLTGDKD